MPDVLLVGKKDTIVNAHPYRVIEYSMQKMKNKNRKHKVCY